MKFRVTTYEPAVNVTVTIIEASSLEEAQARAEAGTFTDDELDTSESDVHDPDDVRMLDGMTVEECD